MDHDQDQVQRFLEAARNATAHLRSAGDLSQRANEHEDSIVMWCVSLAAGGLLYLALSERFRDMPQSILPLALLPWVLTVILGVTGRVLLAHLMVRDRAFGLGRIWRVTMEPLRRPIDMDRQIATEDAVLQEQDISLNRLTKCTTAFSFATMASLGIGVLTVLWLFFASVATCAPVPLPAC